MEPQTEQNQQSEGDALNEALNFTFNSKKNKKRGGWGSRSSDNSTRAFTILQSEATKLNALTQNTESELTDHLKTLKELCAAIDAQTAEDQIAEVKATDVETAEVETAEVEAETTDVDTAEVEAETTDIETAEVEAETTDVDTAEVETTDVDVNPKQTFSEQFSSTFPFFKPDFGSEGEKIEAKYNKYQSEIESKQEATPGYDAKNAVITLHRFISENSAVFKLPKNAKEEALNLLNQLDGANTGALLEGQIETLKIALDPTYTAQVSDDEFNPSDSIDVETEPQDKPKTWLSKIADFFSFIGKLIKGLFSSNAPLQNGTNEVTAIESEESPEKASLWSQFKQWANGLFSKSSETTERDVPPVAIQVEEHASGDNILLSNHTSLTPQADTNANEAARAAVETAAAVEETNDTTSITSRA